MTQGQQLHDIDKPYYRYWQALYNSFYNNQLYVDVAKRWKGLGLGYLLLLLCILALPFSLRIISEFNAFFANELMQPIKDLPILYMQNGKITVNEKVPYYIKNKQGQITTIVDTSGTITSLDNTKYPNLNILITQNKLIYRYPSPHFNFIPKMQTSETNKIEEFSFNKESNSVFDGKEWVKSSKIKHLKLFFILLVYPAITLVAFGFFITLIFAFAMMGQFVAKLFFKTIITYKQSCRMMIVSMTPFMVVMWGLLTFNYLDQSYGFFMPLLFISYYCYAVLAVKRESKKMVRML